MLGSDLTEVHGQSRDYLGPFDITDSNAALFFHAKVDGTPLVFAIVDRSVGEAWRRAYEGAQPMAGPPGALLTQGTLAVGEANMRFPLPHGTYYVVVENQAAAPFAPLGVPLPPIAAPEQVGYLAYSIEIGDR